MSPISSCEAKYGTLLRLYTLILGLFTIGLKTLLICGMTCLNCAIGALTPISSLYYTIQLFGKHSNANLSDLCLVEWASHLPF